MKIFFGVSGARVIAQVGHFYFCYLIGDATKRPDLFISGSVQVFALEISAIDMHTDNRNGISF